MGRREEEGLQSRWRKCWAGWGGGPRADLGVGEGLRVSWDLSGALQSAASIALSLPVYLQGDRALPSPRAWGLVPRMSHRRRRAAKFSNLVPAVRPPLHWAAWGQERAEGPKGLARVMLSCHHLSLGIILGGGLRGVREC